MAHRKRTTNVILVVLGLIFIMALLFTVIFNSRTQTRIFWENKQRELALIIEKSAGDINGWIHTQGTLVEHLSDVILCGMLKTREDYEDFLKLVVERNSEVQAAYLSLDNGVEYFSNDFVVTEDVNTDDFFEWYRIAKEANGALVYTEPYFDALTKDLVVSCLKAITMPDGVEGILGVDISLNNLRSQADSLNPSQTGGTWLVSSGMKVVTYCIDPSFLPHITDDVVGVPDIDLNETLSDPENTPKYIVQGHVAFLNAMWVLRQVEILEIIDTYVESKGILLEHIIDYDGNYKYEGTITLDIGWILGVNIPIVDYANEVQQVINDQVPTILLAVLMSIISIIIAAIFVVNSKHEQRLQKNNMELAQAANRAKSTFLSKMSHEIRTPMNAILGMSELITRKELSPEVREHALEIKTASLNLLSLINDILDFSKIESGMMEIIEAEYELPSLINDVISIIRTRLLETQILFTVNIDSRLPRALIGDEVRVRQVMLNLLSNAVKYTKEGHVSLTVNGTVEENLVMLTMEITDTGVGIKEDDIGRLFGDFIQVDALRNKGIEGTGLGLAIARNLCRAMGGDITLQSEYGKGSTFTITLVQKINLYAPISRVEDAEHKSVLLYESRDIYANSIMRTLENLQIACKSAANLTGLYQAIPAFTHVFVPTFLYGSIKPVLEKMDKPPELVLLADISAPITGYEARTLTMPAYACSITSILNNDYNYISKSYEAGTSFTAPTARVLIVDDIEANLKVTKGLLSPYEMQVDLCYSGREAIDLLLACTQQGVAQAESRQAESAQVESTQAESSQVASQRYDLVLMDHMMPEMDGIEATAHIRAFEDEYFQTLPIVALTANAISGVREMFIQNGMNDFLSKPIETVKLDAILDKWIPNEKKHQGGKPKEREEENEFIKMIKTVPDLSADRAISVMGGAFKTYEQAVRLSIALLPESIGKLNDYIGTDLPRYAIEVHGIKGVLNNIGAYELGRQAQKLEELSKQGDAEQCAALHPPLIEALTAFHEKLAEQVNETESPDKEKGDHQLILDAIPKLNQFIDFYDSAGALEALAPVLEHSYEPEIDKAVHDLESALFHFDFDQALDIINLLDKELEKEPNKEPDKEPSKEPNKEPDKEPDKEPNKEPNKEPDKEQNKG